MLRILCIILIFPLIGCGCNCQHSQSDATTRPVLWLVEYSGNRPGAADSSGLLMAAWEDGTVIGRNFAGAGDPEMRIGTVPREQVQESLRTLQRLDFFAKDDLVLVMPSSGSLQISARRGTHIRTHSVDTFHRTQDRFWNDIIDVAQSLRPTHSDPLKPRAENGEFRGYVIDEWWRTPWIHQ